MKEGNMLESVLLLFMIKSFEQSHGREVLDVHRTSEGFSVHFTVGFLKYKSKKASA